LPAENKQQSGLRRRHAISLRPRRHPALQPALRDGEQENQPVLATRAQSDRPGYLFRMRTIYMTAVGLSPWAGLIENVSS
jgi:hypothetical protein